MRKPEICHSENTAFLDALESCLSSGLSIVLDGIPQTRESPEGERGRLSSEDWIGTILLDDEGGVKGLSFSRKI